MAPGCYQPKHSRSLPPKMESAERKLCARKTNQMGTRRKGTKKKKKQTGDADK